MLIEDPPKKSTSSDDYLDAGVHINVFAEGGNGENGGEGATGGLVAQGGDN